MRKVTLSVLGIIVICLVGLSFNRELVNNEVKGVKGVREIEEKILVKWVFDNSSRISMESSRLIVKECLKTKYPLLLLAIIKVESEFNPGALSSKGAVGLCQIMYDSHKVSLLKLKFLKDKRDLWDIQTNIKCGSYIFEEYLKTSKDVNKALDLYLGTRDGPYVHKIMSNLANLYVVTL